MQVLEGMLKGLKLQEPKRKKIMAVMERETEFLLKKQVERDARLVTEYKRFYTASHVLLDELAKEIKGEKSEA
jgi:hypothetical protein